ncbi:hypothetical protein [Chondromyces apiculatus]|uniref:Uncharacterized protein n=1 Tax=Chondromyces apiculatus DSM 436 TaxID=1192034 RepID=A0A017THC3_9BACT|nr:hypothetical protein [Chondromyces apiculatus]EYF08668.1 Hypothetical protein CAP_2529 [Chondromyces apiculatus DSM 436]
MITNRVGDNSPTAAELSALVTQLTDIVTQLQDFGLILAPEERKRLLHARLEAEPMVQRVHDLATNYGITLQDIPLAGMMNDLDLRMRLHPLADLFRSGLVLAEDTAAQASSEMWEAFLGYYGVLTKMGEQNPKLALELKPVTEFMAKRRPPLKGAPSKTPIPPETTKPTTPSA